MESSNTYLYRGEVKRSLHGTRIETPETKEELEQQLHASQSALGLMSKLFFLQLAIMGVLLATIALGTGRSSCTPTTPENQAAIERIR